MNMVIPSGGMNLLLLLSRELPKEIIPEVFFRLHPPSEHDFIEACAEGKRLLIEMWLSYDLVDVSGPDNTPICWATTNGHTSIVSLLLEHGADASGWMDEPLQWASHYGHLEIVRLLLAHGANASGRNAMPIVHAALNGREEVVSILLCSMRHGARRAAASLAHQSIMGIENYGHPRIVSLLLAEK